MRFLTAIIIILLLVGCKDEDIDSHDRQRIQIDQIKARCERTIDLYDHDQCLGEYAHALSNALSEFINVEVWE
jgi:hypothetical protein